MALFAILAPAWLASEWSVINLEQSSSNSVIPATGLFLLALVYFTTVHANRADVRRRVLLWLGGLSLLPASISLVFATSARFMFGVPPAPLLGVAVRAIGWVLALGLPLIVALVVRRAAAWPITVAVIWLVALLNLHHIPGHIAPYAWWAIGAVAFAAWGVRDVRTERINMGSAMLAATILTFYFSQVMDKMGRSASLIGLGMLCLAGGWVLDRGRRRLVRETRGAGPS
jgi:hypothetical protein